MKKCFNSLLILLREESESIKDFLYSIFIICAVYVVALTFRVSILFELVLIMIMIGVLAKTFPRLKVILLLKKSCLSYYTNIGVNKRNVSGSKLRFILQS